MTTKTANAMTAVAKDELADYDVEVSNWYGKHCKVEAEDETVALRAHGRMAGDDVLMTPVKEYELEWKTETKFVCKRVE